MLIEAIKELQGTVNDRKRRLESDDDKVDGIKREIKTEPNDNDFRRLSVILSVHSWVDYDHKELYLVCLTKYTMMNP